MRTGRIFRRCCRCGSRVTTSSCERCGWTDSTWGFVVDTAPKGFPRCQTKRGGFKTEKDAGAAMAELLRDRREGGRADVTTGQFLTGWLRDAASGGSIRRTTAKAYDVAIRVHIVPRLGRLPLRRLSRPLIRDLYEFLRLRGRARGSAGGLAPKTIHNVHLTLHRALQDAVADGLITSNPAARAHRMARFIPTFRCWSAEELHRFLIAADRDAHFALWRLAASTGMRRGEVLGLRWHDVDLQRRLVTVRRQLIRDGDALAFGHPKTAAGRRTICVDANTMLALEKHRVRQAALRGNCNLASGRADDLVFCRANGLPRDPDAVSHQFAELIVRAGLPKIRFHDLRHTHATIALQAAINPKVVQERLGHASVYVTLDTYTHVLPPMHEEAASRIALLVDGRTIGSP